MKKIIVMLGAPCSGKDTHAKMLALKLKFKYCSSDDIIAEEIKNKTKIGLVAERYLSTKTKMPDEYLIMLVKEIIINLKEDGIVFNDFPKTVNQAKALDTFLFSRKTTKPIAVFLNTESPVILKRLKEKSEDKSFDYFMSVMNNYDAKTKSVANYYLKNRIEFDTSKESVEDVNEEITKKIKELFDCIK
jgi:adenylate kinase